MEVLLCAFGVFIVFLVLCCTFSPDVVPDGLRALVPYFYLFSLSTLGVLALSHWQASVFLFAVTCLLGCVVYHYRVLVPLLWRDVDDLERQLDAVDAGRDRAWARCRDIRRKFCALIDELAQGMHGEAEADAQSILQLTAMASKYIKKSNALWYRDAANCAEIDEQRKTILTLRHTISEQASRGSQDEHTIGTQAVQIDDLTFGADLDAIAVARLTKENRALRATLRERAAVFGGVVIAAADQLRHLRETVKLVNRKVQLLTPVVNQHGTTADRAAQWEALMLSEIDDSIDVAAN